MATALLSTAFTSRDLLVMGELLDRRVVLLFFLMGLASYNSQRAEVPLPGPGMGSHAIICFLQSCFGF